jgi:hypothetical protein
MRSLTSILLLAFVLPAQAQMYKCVDARGKIQYSDKPIAGCRAEKTIAAPPPSRAAPAQAPVARAKASARPKEAPKVADTEAVAPSQLAARCQTLHEEQQWLNSTEGKTVQFHTERVAQVEQALGACH